ncbi:MAG: hypothetical protein AAB131_05840, partial [Actinomycetota bacterium]
MDGRTLTLNAVNNINISAGINSTGTSLLHLVLSAGGSVTTTADIDTNGGNITITAVGAVSLNTITTAGGSLTVDAGTTLALTAAVSTGGGFVDLDALGALTMTAAVTTGGGNFTATSGGLLTTNAITVGTGAITLVADEVDLAASASGIGGTLTIRGVTGGQDIILGAGSETVGNLTDLDLTTSDLSNILAGFTQITIGDAAASGTVSVVGVSNFADSLTIRSSTFSVGVGASLNTSDDILTIFADSMTLSGNVNSGTAMTWIRPTTAGQLIDLGGADAAGTLGISATDLTRLVTTGVLRIGDATAGNITVTAAFAPAGTLGTLSLETGGSITDT